MLRCGSALSGIHVANILVQQTKLLGHEATLYDAKALKLPLLEKPLHHYKSDESVPSWLADLGKQFEEADAFIVCDGEYNHGPTPGIINLLDHFYHKQYKFKAAGIASYGAAAGGARAAYVLRNTLGELGMVVSPTNFMVPQVWTQIDFAKGEFNSERPLEGMAKFLREFTFLAQVLKAAKPNAPLA